MSLLQRLASVGLGRAKEEPQALAEPPANVRVPVRPIPRVADRLPPRPAPRMPESRGPDPVSEYAKRPTHQVLDTHGRQAPVHNPPDDDQLDIPAFLRRQAN